MVTTMIAFVLNTYLTLALEWPKVFESLNPNNKLNYFDYFKILIQLIIYLISIFGVFYFSYVFRDESLRKDSLLLNKIVNYFIRSCFWAVVFVGLADVIISFLRVEDLLDNVVGKELATELGRSKFRGPYVHIPLVFLGFIVGAFIKHIAFTWLAFLVVIAELLIVITRFVFSYEQAFQGDLVRFWYAALYLFASAYALIHEGHVRVDVLYANFSERKKAWTNAIGSLILGIPLCLIVIFLGMGGKASIINGPVISFEITQQGSNGLYLLYLMAVYLAVFAVSMLTQFTSYFMSSSHKLLKN